MRLRGWCATRISRVSHLEDTSPPGLTIVIKWSTIVIEMSTDIRSARQPRVPPVLRTLLGSAARAKLLSHFLLHPGETFHVRALQRILGEPAGNLLRDLRRLQAIDLLQAERVGNQVRYALNQGHPLYQDLQRLVVRASAAHTILKDALSLLKGIELAFLYGSFVRGDADVRSDLDLMVIGSVSDRTLTPVLARAERVLGREVAYTRFSRAEARAKAQQAGSFVQSVFSGPKIVFIGREDDELFRLAER
ncbi:MAG: nucleotidyltransferase domain-containing protein [Armatimonadetes bacterium]|nr:nucleotidyltransferase domain-containing protein [Armatimonadota bacterium]